MNSFSRGAAKGVLILLALAAGCVDQRKDIATYQKELDRLPGATLPVPNDTQALTLQDAMRLSLNDNLTLGQSGELYIQALAAKDLAFSELLPTLSLGPSLTESQPLGSRVPPEHNFNVPLNANVNALNVPDYYNVGEATALAEESRHNLRFEQQTVLLDVVTAYYAVLISERQVTVYENSLNEQEERLRQSREQYRLQMGTPLAISQSESLVSQTRVNLIAARASVITNRAALATLLGSPAAKRPLSDGFDPPQSSQLSLEGWIAFAFGHREDLMAAARQVDADRELVRAAISQYYPSVTVNLNYLLYNKSESLQERLTSILAANIPIFTGGEIEANVRSAFSQLRAAVLAYRAAHRQVEQDIRTGYANWIYSIDQVRELRVELAANRDALKYSQAEYNVGLAINLDVLTALDQLLTTELALATEEYNEKTNYLQLLRDANQLDLVQAAPSTQPSLEPSQEMEEITTPEIVHSTTQPALPPVYPRP